MLLKLHKINFIFIIPLFLVLSSCGFHLRAPVSLAKPLQNLYVESQAPYGEVTRNIKQYLRISGIHLATSAEEAETILKISHESIGQELLSINSSQQTRQYNLKLQINFEISDNKGRVILPSQMLTETRPLTLQSNQILASSNQAAQLYHDMRRAIVYSLMNRLASQSTTQALAKAEDQAPL